MAATAAIAARPFSSAAALSSHFTNEPGGSSLRILHTNDIAACLNAGKNGLGGFYQTAETISKFKKGTVPVLLVDAGNTFSGNETESAAHKELLTMMHELGYDAMAAAQKDFAMGTESFAKQFNNNAIPFIASNYSVSDSTVADKLAEYQIVEKGNIRIGIISAGSFASKTGFEQQPTIETLNKKAAYLKNRKKCNLVICLSQLGYQKAAGLDDLSLAAVTSNIDIILGSGARFMKTPTVVMNLNREEVVINQAGHSGIVLGNIEVQFSARGKKKAVHFNNLVVGTPDYKWANEIA